MPHIAADSSGVTGSALGTTLRLVTRINMHCPQPQASGETKFECRQKWTLKVLLGETEARFCCMGNRPWINRAIVSGSLYNLMAWNREMPENSSPLLSTSGQAGPGEREGKQPEQRAIFNSSCQ